MFRLFYQSRFIDPGIRFIRIYQNDLQYPIENWPLMTVQGTGDWPGPGQESMDLHGQESKIHDNFKVN